MRKLLIAVALAFVASVASAATVAFKQDDLMVLVTSDKPCPWDDSMAAAMVIDGKDRSRACAFVRGTWVYFVVDDDGEIFRLPFSLFKTVTPQEGKTY